MGKTKTPTLPLSVQNGPKYSVCVVLVVPDISRKQLKLLAMCDVIIDGAQGKYTLHGRSLLYKKRPRCGRHISISRGIFISGIVGSALLQLFYT